MKNMLTFDIKGILLMYTRDKNMDKLCIQHCVVKKVIILKMN